jgi:hypothetical protein
VDLWFRRSAGQDQVTGRSRHRRGRLHIVGNVSHIVGNVSHIVRDVSRIGDFSEIVKTARTSSRIRVINEPRGWTFLQNLCGLG